MFQFLRAELVAAVLLVNQHQNSASHPFIPVCVNKGVVVVVVAVVAVVFPPMVSHAQEGESKRVVCDQQQEEERERESFGCKETANTALQDSASPRLSASCTPSHNSACASSDTNPSHDPACASSDTPHASASCSSPISSAFSDTPHDFASSSSLISSASSLVTSESPFQNFCCPCYLFFTIARKAGSAIINDKFYTTEKLVLLTVQQHPLTLVPLFLVTGNLLIPPLS